MSPLPGRVSGLERGPSWGVGKSASQKLRDDIRVIINTPHSSSLSKKKYFLQNKDIIQHIITFCRHDLALLRHICLYTCGGISLTPHRAPPPPCVGEVELQEADETPAGPQTREKSGAPSAEDDLRVRVNAVRPMWGNRAEPRPIITLVQKSRAVAVIPLAHANACLAAEGMKGVRSPAQDASK